MDVGVPLLSMHRYASNSLLSYIIHSSIREHCGRKDIESLVQSIHYFYNDWSEVYLLVSNISQLYFYSRLRATLLLVTNKMSNFVLFLCSFHFIFIFPTYTLFYYIIYHPIFTFIAIVSLLFPTLSFKETTKKKHKS